VTRHTTATTPQATPACHYDRDLEQRVIRTRRPDDQGAGPDELVPCTHPHCVICGREHTTHAHPLTCPTCIAAVRRDLEDIRWLARHLRWHAARGEGLAVPSARIPGGDALVAIARAGAGWDDLHTRFGPLKDNPKADLLTEDHPADDVMPVLLPLLGWEHQWRTHFGHTRRTTDRSPVTAITRYFEDQLDRMAQTTTGPDWQTFTADITALRRQLEGILHDERDPERGVPCFECGDRLVRRFGDPRPCRHQTPARRHLTEVERRAAAGRATLAAIATYPELRGEHVTTVDPVTERPVTSWVPGEYPSGWTPAELAAARPPSSAEVSAARIPCTDCVDRGQGGIDNPAVGQSWECLGCRKQYTPGEYAHAVRRHLLTSGPNGDSWTHIGMAAEAATMMGVPVTPSTVRRWMDRNQVIAVCRWTPHVTWGLRLVYWPSVKERAERAAEQAARAAAERARLDSERVRWRKAVEAGTDPDEAGRLLGIHPARVARFEAELDAEARRATG